MTASKPTRLYGQPKTLAADAEGAEMTKLRREMDRRMLAEGFGGETTMRAKVFRELINEIRALRIELRRVERVEARRDKDGGT